MRKSNLITITFVVKHIQSHVMKFEFFRIYKTCLKTVAVFVQN